MDLVAQATPAQLSHVFDLDLWRPSRAGRDEQFDVARFGLWIEVLVEAGVEVAAAKLAEMPLPQIVAGLANHIDVYDVAAVSTYETTDGEQWDYSRPIRDRIGCEIAGFHVAARREDAWDAIIDVLVALDMHHQDRFVALMRAIRSRSHSRRERDGFHALLDNRDQMMFDAATERDRRLEERGFASAAEARAFLHAARSAKTGESAFAMKPRMRAPEGDTEGHNDRDTVEAVEAPPTPEEDAEIAELLVESGIMQIDAPRALLGSGDAATQSAIERYMQAQADRDAVAFGDRNFELAYLANVLMTGCSIQNRAFTPKEAADAVTATCNLGFELNADAPDLIAAFQIGWATLHHDVCIYAANALVDVLSSVRVADDDTQSALNLLKVRLVRELKEGMPWRAAAALDVLTTIDMPAWAALVGLIAECPVIHGGLIGTIDRTVRAIDPDGFEFIARPDQLALVRTFMTSLPEILQ